MKDWKTPEIKDLAISDTECNEQGVNGACYVPFDSGVTGDMDFGDKEHGKDHGHKHNHNRK